MKQKILDTINFHSKTTMDNLKHGSTENKVKAALTLVGAGAVAVVTLYLVFKLFWFVLLAAAAGGGYYWWKQKH